MSRLVRLFIGAALALAVLPQPAAAVPPTSQPCVAEPCELTFDAKRPPRTARSPEASLHITLSPLRIEFNASGLGTPSSWVTGGDANAASSYGLYILETDENSTAGGQLCVLDADLDCTATEIPRPSTSGTYARIALLAIKDIGSDPAPAEMNARLVTSMQFSPPLQVSEAAAVATPPPAARTGPGTLTYVALVALGLLALGWGTLTRAQERRTTR